MNELHLSEQIHLSGNRGVWITMDFHWGYNMITAMYAMFYTILPQTIVVKVETGSSVFTRYLESLDTKFNQTECNGACYSIRCSFASHAHLF